MTTVKYSLLAATLVTTLFLGFSGGAIARDGGYGGGYHGGGCGGMGGMSTAPTLTPEQTATVEKLHADFFTATVAIRQQLIVKRAELQAELLGNKPDPQKVEKLSTEIGTLRGKMINERNALASKLEEAGISTTYGGMRPCALGNTGCGGDDDMGHRGNR